jgi:hypothetical protein
VVSGTSSSSGLRTSVEGGVTVAGYGIVAASLGGLIEREALFEQGDVFGLEPRQKLGADLGSECVVKLLPHLAFKIWVHTGEG